MEASITFPLFAPIPDVALPGLSMLGFGVVFFLILYCLIVVVETTALQLLGWGDLRASLKAAVIMNLVSSLAGFGLLMLIPALGLFGLLLAWAISVLIEWFVLHRLRPAERRQEITLAVVANLASYLILLLPAYLMAETL